MCIRGIPPSHRLILVVVQHTTLYKKTYNDMYALKRKTETEKLMVKSSYSINASNRVKIYRHTIRINK